MSVFTAVTEEQLRAFLTRYAVGSLTTFRGIEAGVENTNYFVDTDQGSYVLTLFEVLPIGEVDQYLELTLQLARQNVPCASPIAMRDKSLVSKLNDRPAALVTRLRGNTREVVEADHCAEVGRALARMHLVLGDYHGPSKIERGRKWQRRVIADLGADLEAAEMARLEEFLDGPDIYTDLSLPGGVIHSDLFRDNALFDDDGLSGLIDFYSAHRGPLIYDLAVTVLDWSHDENNRFRHDLGEGVYRGYAEVRAPTTDEHQAWHLALKSAAARFLVSRLFDRRFPRQGSMIMTKNPDRFRRIFDHLHEPENALLNLLA